MDKPSGLDIINSEGANYLARSLQKSLSEEVQPTQSESLLGWTLEHRVINRKSVTLPPSQIPIYEDMDHEVVIMKGTQVFVSEYLVNLSLWALDTRYANRGNVLYMMPTQGLMDDFSQSRIDKAIEDSRYLNSRFEQAASQNQTNRARLKRLEGSSLHMRGSDSLKQAISVDADVVIDDEVDWFSEEAVQWTRDRYGSSNFYLFRAVSKPTYPEQGIHLMYKGSDQREWHIKCEHCNKWQSLVWEDNIIFSLDQTSTTVTNVRLVCSNKSCRKDIDRLSNGEWVAAYPDRRVHGYHLSRLLSPMADLRGMAEDSIDVSDIPKLQRFYNSGLGIPYAPKGGKLDSAELVYDNNLEFKYAGQGYGGVDVGLKLHACIIEKQDDRWPLRQAEEFDTFEELDAWFSRNNVKACIIDARGDPRATTEWASNYPGRVYRWSHIESTDDIRYNEDSQEVKLNRTALLDNMYKACRTGRVVFPTGIRHVTGFLSHLQSLVRELIKDPRLNKLIPRYVGAAPDHYAFALAYAVLAAGEDIASPAPAVIPRAQEEGQYGRPSPSWTGIRSSKGWRVG